MSKPKLSPEEYLKLPYTRILIPDEESGTFTAEIVEFPGCISQGYTAKEAYERLEEVAKSWIEAALDLEQEIPSPLVADGYSGRFALRLPKSLHRQASLAADRDGTSLNQFIISAISEKVGASNLYERLTQSLLQQIEYQQFIILQKTFDETSETLVYGIEVANTWRDLENFENAHFVNAGEAKQSLPYNIDNII